MNPTRIKQCLVFASAYSLFMVFHGVAYTENKAEETFEERIPDTLIERDDQFFTFTFENDLFTGSDKYYTNGARLSHYDTGARMPNKIKNTLNKVPGIDITETSSVYYSIGQNLYTPQDLTVSAAQPNDRPYAGFLYGAIGASTLEDNHVDNVELALGVVGPSALGKETQKTVHRWSGAQDPKGWDNQLKDEPAIMLSAERVWPEAHTEEFKGLLLRVSPHVGATLGNVYTYGAAGATFQLTPKKYQWQTPPIRVRPAIPGSGYFAVPEGAFAWSLFAGIEGRAIARNIFLDGNTFKDSHSVDKKPFVADFNTGVSLTKGRARISYTINWRTKEFDNQSSNAMFGAVSVGYRF